jgi:hypothetical protein
MSLLVRVLRILEYIYYDNARAEEDMARWQVPPVGTRRHGNMMIKSAVITQLNFGQFSEPLEEYQGKDASSG